MHLSFEGDAQLLRRLAQRSLVGMGMGDMEVVDVNGGVTVVGHRPRRNYSIGTLVNKCAGAIRIQEVQPPYRREKESLAGR